MTKEMIEPVISSSLFISLNLIEKQLHNFNSEILNEVKQYLNTYEFISTNVPQTNLSVSKVKPDNCIFYELMEIFFMCNLNEFLKFKKKIIAVHFTPNHTSSNYFMNLIREDNDDMCITTDFNANEIMEIVERENVAKSDFLFMEFQKNDYSNLYCYFKNMIVALYTILQTQNYEGISIIKIDNIFYKIFVDIIYILSGLYDKVYIIKPSVSNIMSNERYIVCKHFVKSSQSQNMSHILHNLINFMDKNEEMNTHENGMIYSLIKNEIPYYFMNRIEESNTVIGQQQLETYSLLINILKNKNKEDKIETLKRNHLQKCIQWCEKYRIPHNKFIDKTNIFLNIRTPNDFYEPQEQEQEQEQELGQEIVEEHNKICIDTKYIIENMNNINIDIDNDIHHIIEECVSDNMEINLDI
jgi:hypothetical protein